jgi:hypothetical protein
MAQQWDIAPWQGLEKVDNRHRFRWGFTTDDVTVSVWEDDHVARARPMPFPVLT